MTNLQCSVTKCANNSQNYCCRPDIQVRGKNANTSPQTCCSSFLDKSSAASNAVGYQQPNQSLQIGCDASNCSYNEAGRCFANAISVQASASNAVADNETQCASFVSR